MKPILKTSVIATFFYASTAVAVPLELVGDEGLIVFESLDNGLGIYDVTNNTGGGLIGFGVSNNDSTPVVKDFGSGFTDQGTAFADNDGENQFTYWVRTLTQLNWATESVNLFEVAAPGETLSTFFDIFGEFSTVAGGENTINWYDAVDGWLEDGNTVSGFFGFQAVNVASSVIGVTDAANGPVYFTAGQAITGTTNAVPLPATGWLMITGLASLITLRRKRRTDRTA